jgi:hypothetical protein
VENAMQHFIKIGKTVWNHPAGMPVHPIWWHEKTGKDEGV